MDGFTGFNPSQLLSEIMVFYNNGIEQVIQLKDTLDTFAERLSSLWCAPKAVEFSPRLGSLYSAIENLRIEYAALAHDLMNAYNQHAERNSMPKQENHFSKDTAKLDDDSEKNHYSLKEVSNEGKVGMDVNSVTDALTDFIGTLNGLLSEDMSFPPSLYDPSGEQVRVFKERLSKEVSNINSKIDTIIVGISNAISEEKTQMSDSVAKATSELSS